MVVRILAVLASVALLLQQAIGIRVGLGSHARRKKMTKVSMNTSTMQAIADNIALSAQSFGNTSTVRADDYDDDTVSVQMLGNNSIKRFGIPAEEETDQHGIEAGAETLTTINQRQLHNLTNGEPAHADNITFWENLKPKYCPLSQAAANDCGPTCVLNAKNWCLGHNAVDLEQVYKECGDTYTGDCPTWKGQLVRVLDKFHIAAECTNDFSSEEHFIDFFIRTAAPYDLVLVRLGYEGKSVGHWVLGFGNEGFLYFLDPWVTSEQQPTTKTVKIVPKFGMEFLQWVYENGGRVCQACKLTCPRREGNTGSSQPAYNETQMAAR